MGMLIVKRDDVVRRLTAKRDGEVTAAQKAVNEAINAAADLPVKLPLAALGAPAVRELVLKQLKDAGWRTQVDAPVGAEGGESILVLS